MSKAKNSKKPTSIDVGCSGLKSLENGKRPGVSCKQEIKTGKFFVATHRARSKAYDSFSSIPLSQIKFIDSTG